MNSFVMIINTTDTEHTIVNIIIIIYKVNYHTKINISNFTKQDNQSIKGIFVYSI